MSCRRLRPEKPGVGQVAAKARRRTLHKRPDGAFPRVAQVFAVGSDEGLDMRACHGIVQLLRMRADEVARGLGVRPGVAQAGGDARLYGKGRRRRKAPARGDGPERQGQVERPLPPPAEIKDLAQAVPFIGEAALVDDDPDVGLAAGHGIHDVAEEQFAAFSPETSVQVKKQVGRGHEARHSRACRDQTFRRQGCGCHHQGAAAPAQGRARCEEGICVHDARNRAQGQFRHVQTALHSQGIQFFHIREMRHKTDVSRPGGGSGHTHMPFKKSVKDEGIIGAG